VHTVPPRLTGLRAERRRDIAAGQQGVARYVVTGPIAAPRGLGHARAFAREHAIEPRLDKVAIPTAFTIGLSFPRSELTPTVLGQLGEVVEAEIRAAVAAGAIDVQLDAPSEAIACIQGTTPLDELAELIAAPLAGLAGTGVRRTVHFCLGDIARRPSTEIQNLRSLLPLLQHLDGHIDRALVECSYHGQWKERALLAEVPEAIEVVAGIGDVKAAPAGRDHYARLIEELLAHVPAHRLLVSTSCGCGRMPHDDAIRLNLELVRAARAVSGAPAP
jgi:methionine synthase II (cobalamin-independent)